MGRCWNFCWGGHPKGVNYQGLLSTHPLCATARRLGGHPKAVNYQGLLSTHPLTCCAHCLAVFDGSDAGIFVGGGHPKAVNY